MSVNAFKILKGLFPDPPLLVGDVVSISNGTATINLLDGGTIQARGEATVGDRVFVRDNVIEAQAPMLTLEIIDV